MQPAEVVRSFRFLIPRKGTETTYIPTVIIKYKIFPIFNSPKGDWNIALGGNNGEKAKELSDF